MGKYRLTSGLVALVILAGFVGIRLWATAPVTSTIEWENDLRSAHQQSVQTGKPMLIVFGADWCSHCAKLEDTTLADPRVGDYVNASFIPLHLNLDRNKRVAQILEVRSIPCSIVLSPEADLLGRMVGYVKPSQLYQTLSSAREVQDQIRQARFEMTADIR